MSGQWNVLVDSGTQFSWSLWWPTGPGAYYNFAPVGVPGTPVLSAKDSNGNIVLALSTIPDVRGSYCKVGSGTFTASDGTVLTQGYWLEAFLSADTTAMFKSHILYWQLDFTPPGVFSPIRFIAADSKMIFSRDNSTGCVSNGETALTFMNDLLAAGYSAPIEDDWQGGTAPPTSPVAGISYIVPRAATGAWAGKDGQVATWTGAGWIFSLLTNGVTAYIRNRYGRAQLVDFNHAAPNINTLLRPSSGNTMAWVEDFKLDSMVGDYAGVVQGVSNTPPASPTPWEKWLVGASPSWPDYYGIVNTNMIATAVVDHATNTVRWVYRRNTPGLFFYRVDNDTPYYINGVGTPVALTSAADVDTLAGLADVQLTGLAAGQYLTYNGAYWVNTNNTLGSHTDTTFTGLSAGDVPTWDGSKWVNSPGGATPQLRTLPDTNIPLHPLVADDGKAVTYDFASDKFVLAVAGGPAGPAGPAGPTGPTGATGATGAAGSMVFIGASVRLAATLEFENPAGIVTTGAGSFNFLIPAGYNYARFWVQYGLSATSPKKAWGITSTTTAPGGGGAYTDVPNSGFGAIGDYTLAGAGALTYNVPADPGAALGVSVRGTDYSEVIAVTPGLHYSIVGAPGPIQYRHGIEIWK